MAEKKWLIILGVINVLAMAGIVFWYVNRDHTPPVITQREEIVYEEMMSDSELLRGAVAMDETDGDVSHTLVVEKITVNHNTGIAMITCGAMDTSGNIAKQSFRMEMKEAESPIGDSVSDPSGEVFTLEAGEAVIGAENTEVDLTEESIEEDFEAEEETTEEEMTEEETVADESEDAQVSDEEQEENPDENSAANQQENAQNSTPQVNTEEIPILNFGSGEVKTKKGYNPAWVTVISQLQDNKDNYEYLLQHLKMNGEFTNSTVGSYDVTVYTVDSDGNESAARAIRIIVEE